jgi:hypothetical protein
MDGDRRSHLDCLVAYHVNQQAENQMMEQKSMERVTTVVLRGAGVLVMLVGLILVTHTIVSLIAAHSAMSGFPGGQLPPGMSVNLKGAAGRVGGWAVFAQATTIGWGFLLMALAPSIAQKITKEQ